MPFEVAPNMAPPSCTAAPDGPQSFIFTFHNVTRPNVPFGSVLLGLWSTRRRPCLASLSNSIASSKWEMWRGGKPGLPTPQARGHSDEWYRERCVFCAECKESIRDGMPAKRGARCMGCRQWRHHACKAAAADAAHVASSLPKADATRAAFHSAECQAVYESLAAVASAGRHELPPSPPPQGWRWPWQRAEEAPRAAVFSWRLLELDDVRQQLKQLKREGVWDGILHQRRQRKRQQRPAARPLVQQGGTDEVVAPPPSPPARSEAASADAAGAGAAATALPEFVRDASRAAQLRAEGTDGVVQARPHVHHQQPPLEAFLDVSELLAEGAWQEPLLEQLEDSFAMELRNGDHLLAVAVFNTYGADHARLQNVVTARDAQRQGHACTLLGQLHSVLSRCGVRQSVAMIEPDVSAQQRSGLDRLFCRRLGYREVDVRQLVAWRQAIPEYHKALVGGCALLVKDVSAVAPRRP